MMEDVSFFPQTPVWLVCATTEQECRTLGYKGATVAVPLLICNRDAVWVEFENILENPARALQQ